FSINFENYQNKRFDIYWQNDWTNNSSSYTIYTGSSSDYNFVAAFSDFDFNVDSDWALVLKEYDESDNLIATHYGGINDASPFWADIKFTGISSVLYCGQYDNDEDGCTAHSPTCVFSSVTSLCLAPQGESPGYPSEEDFNDWYTANSSGEYETPTPLASAIGGFLYNVFNSFGDTFGTLLTNFNTTDAFNQGRNLGLIWPKSMAYLDKLSFFIGGFPISTIFQILIIAILAVVVIKIIFKFIPFFG
ncbi:MAG: hypothetical protein WC310_05765, partial [Patescibacteria group bacterium]